MKITDRQLEKIEATLFEAGRRTGSAAPAGAWQSDLMRRIRQTGPLNAMKEAEAAYGWLVWKVALPVAACAVALCIVVASTGVADDYASQRAEINNTFEYLMSNII